MITDPGCGGPRYTLIPGSASRLWSGKHRGSTVPNSREESRRKHAEETGHADYVETMYGVICSTCHDYIVIDYTNCAPACREHESCRQAYATEA